MEGSSDVEGDLIGEAMERQRKVVLLTNRMLFDSIRFVRSPKGKKADDTEQSFEVFSVE